VVCQLRNLLIRRGDTVHQLRGNIGDDGSAQVKIAVDLYAAIELSGEFASDAVDADAAVRVGLSLSCSWAWFVFVGCGSSKGATAGATHGGVARMAVTSSFV
jgi:hypothetical protein